MIIGILGGGQLGMMLCQVASKLNIQTFIYSDTDDSPAIKYANHFLIKKYDDFHEIDNFIKKCDFVTYEFENIPFKTLSYIEQKIKISPSSEINQIIQDRLTEKNYVNKINIPTVPYMEINNTSDLKSVDPKFFPAILKTRKLGYDGKGQIVINSKKDISDIPNNEYILEKKINLQQEISIIAVRYKDGTIFTYQPIENIHKNQILFKSFSPANSEKSIIKEATNHAYNFAEKISYVGTFCLEFFINEEKKLLLNEIAPRVHNSGHLTIESYNVSQFESHIRSVCDLEKVEPSLKSKSEMINILGDDIYNYREKSFKENEYFHDYHKKESKTGRKMGHFTKVLI